MTMEKDKNTLAWIFIAVIIVLFLIGSFGMGFGFIFMLLLWGVLIWLVVTLINAGQSGKKEEDPSSILKKRYASGEISKKQYGEMKKELLP